MTKMLKNTSIEVKPYKNPPITGPPIVANESEVWLNAIAFCILSLSTKLAIEAVKAILLKVAAIEIQTVVR